MKNFGCTTKLSFSYFNFLTLIRWIVTLNLYLMPSLERWLQVQNRRFLTRRPFVTNNHHLSFSFKISRRRHSKFNFLSFTCIPVWRTGNNSIFTYVLINKPRFIVNLEFLNVALNDKQFRVIESYLKHLSNFLLGVFFLVSQDIFYSFESQWGQVCPTSHTEYSGVSVVSIGFNNPRFEVVNQAGCQIISNRQLLIKSLW